MGLYQKYRPKTLKEVIGQESAIKSIQKLCDVGQIPHTIAFTGPSGVGKTTIARILKTTLKCEYGDFAEMNCASNNGIDMVRALEGRIGLAPMYGKSRIWLIDEAHNLTKEAQDALLKILEDVPKHVYFFLATTDYAKLKPTVRTRCTEIKLVPVSPKYMTTLLESVVDREKMDVSDVVIATIVEAAEGSARKALVLLEQVGYLESEKEQIAGVESSSVNKDQAILLARALVSPAVKWPEIASILSNLTDEPENVRYLMLGYFQSILLKGGNLMFRAADIIDIFSNSFYTSKKAGLCKACFDVVHLGRIKK